MDEFKQRSHLLLVDDGEDFQWRWNLSGDFFARAAQAVAGDDELFTLVRGLADEAGRLREAGKDSVPVDAIEDRHELPSWWTREMAFSKHLRTTGQRVCWP